MNIPENNTIIESDIQPDVIQQKIADKQIAQLDASTPNVVLQAETEAIIDQEHNQLKSYLEEDNSNKELLGLSTDEQRVLKFITLHNPNDRYFINWTNVFTLGELYYSNYSSEEFRAYQNKFKLITAKYYNPKKYILEFTNDKITAYTRIPEKKTDEDPHILDSLDKPTFLNSQDEIKNGYTQISQLRIQLEHTYKYLSGLPYLEPNDKKKFIKLRNKFIRLLNAYYTHMYYYNRINNFVMTEKQITLPHIVMGYSEDTNEMHAKIDKVTIRLSDDIITQKYNNESAKLELYLAIKQKMIEQHTHPKDKKINEELSSLLKEYVNFDKTYQVKLLNQIQQRKSKKIICECVIFSNQPLPGDGSVDTTNTDISADTQSDVHKVVTNNSQPSGYSKKLEDMDEKERNRKFFFINRAKREKGY